MKWFRVYHDMPHDPKLRRIAHQAGATFPHTLAVWLFMLCHASQNEGEARGTLAGWSDDDCAFALGMDRAIVFAIRNQMEARTLDGDRIIAWSKRQAQSDNTTSRWVAWNEKRRIEREQKQQVSSEPTLDQRLTNDAPTLDQRLRGEEKREEEKASALASSEGGVGGDAPRPAQRRTTGTRLPKDWWPNGAEQNFARDLGLDAVKVADSFRDYWHAKAGKDATKVDWTATWRGWCRREGDRQRTRQPESKLAWMDDHPMFRSAS